MSTSLIDAIASDLEFLQSVKSKVATELGGAWSQLTEQERIKTTQTINQLLRDPTKASDGLTALVCNVVSALTRISTRFTITDNGIEFHNEKITFSPKEIPANVLIAAVNLHATLHLIRSTLTLDKTGIVLLNVFMYQLPDALNYGIIFSEYITKELGDLVFANNSQQELNYAN